MNLYSIIKNIICHPLNKKNRIGSLIRFFIWQIVSRLGNYSIIYPFTDKTKLIIKKGMTGATGNLYTGLHEFNDMGFLLHFLREEDLFIDIGANIGSYTILASGHVGANTISIEPVPITFNFLKNNIILNQLNDKVIALNLAVGSISGHLEFTTTLDTVNHVATKSDNNTISVKVKTLDEIINNGNYPLLIKIDVEGFESEVIKGAQEVLKNTTLKAIIIELNGTGIRYNFDETLIHNLFIDLNFLPYKYNPINRSLVQLKTFGYHNTIYIRDIDFVSRRVNTANKFTILNQNI